MKYILKTTANGIDFITDEDLDKILQNEVPGPLTGLTLREAIRVDLNDSLGWKKAGYHPEMIRQKLIFKYQSEAISIEAIPR